MSHSPSTCSTRRNASGEVRNSTWPRPETAAQRRRGIRAGLANGAGTRLSASEATATTSEPAGTGSRASSRSVPFPQLDLRMRTPDAAPAHTAAAAAPTLERRIPIAPCESERDLGPDDWSEAEVRAAAKQLATSADVAIRDRHPLLRVFRNAFVGREAVDWLTSRFGLTRAEAVELGERWVELGLVRHVLDEHGFRDEPLYYEVRSAG